MKLPKFWAGIAPRWRWILLASLGLVGLLSASAALAFGPYVRHRARLAASRYGAELEIGSASPFWKGVVLRNVQVKLDDVPSATIALAEVTVTSGDPRVVTIHGGNVTFSGDLDRIQRELAALRERMKKRDGSAAEPAAKTEIHVDGLEVVLHAGGDGLEADVVGLAVARAADGYALDAASAQVAFRGTTLKAAHAHLDLGESGGSMALKKIATQSLDADVSGGTAETVAAAAEPGEPASAERLVALRDRIVAIEPAIDAKLPPGATIELGGVEAHVHRGADTLNVGPGTLRLGRDAGRIVGEYESSASVDGKTLKVKAKLPIAGEPFAVDVVGGPITLATLGVKNGDMKLLDVEQTTLSADVHLVLAPDGKSAELDGSGSVADLGFEVPSISPEPVRGMRLSFRGKAGVALDGSHARVEGGEIEVGALQIHGDVDYQRLAVTGPDEAPKFRLRSSFEVPLTACQTLVDAAPKGLMPTIAGIKMAGSIALKGHANFDTTRIDHDYDVDWATANSCRVTGVPPTIDVKNFQHVFTRSVYTPTGARTEVKSGPGSGNWASYTHISHFMETAVITCEDGRFESHDGFDHEAIVNSIRENLRTGKFVRGASTISMQLAKNLYLTRDKTISRKLEEAILTMYLEQALTKQQIMELYLNVVELGPMVYGVEAASAHYFHSTAGQLALSQAFYLASILPAPKVQHFGPTGAVSGGWMARLRTLMKYANKRNRVTDEELDEGLSEIVVLGSPAPAKDPAAKTDTHEEEAPPDPSRTTDPAGFQVP